MAWLNHLRGAVCALLVGILAAPAMSATAQPAAEQGLSAYRLGPGDKVRVTTYGEASLTGQFEVSGSGVIALPLIGEVKAQGATTTELQTTIAAALRDGYLKDPRVSIEVLSYRPYYILGEVTRPGEYPYSNGLTVLNAVATANGFTYRANTKHVLIRRAGESGEHDYPLTGALPVAPGDTLRIKERMF